MKATKHRARARFYSGSFCALWALAWGSAASAQSATDDVATTTGLSEIIVTAERRQQSLQDVPISATVLNADDVIRKGVSNLSDIQQVAPSIAINTFNRSTFINIRGVGIAQTAPTSNPGVAYYIDGQLIPHEQFIGQSFFDIGSIEVLRGPQGTLAGQNSTGGAIFVRSPEPVFNETSGYIDQTVGKYGWYRTVAAVNIGEGDLAALRIAGVHEQRQSFTRNIGPSPSNPGNINLDTIRANLALRSADGRLRVNVRGEYFNFESDNIAIKNRLDAVTSDPFVIEEDALSFLNQKGYRLSTEVRYDLTDGVQTRALISWQDGTTTDKYDGDRTATAAPRPPAGNVGRVGTSSTTYETLITEINVLSTGRGPFQWVVGGFRMRDKVPVVLLRDNNNTVDFVSSTSSIITTADNTSESLFGQGNLFVTDRIELIAGARYSWDRQDYERIASPGGLGTSTARSRQLTGKLGINYHATERTLLYATASKGYKAGGVNLTLNTPDFGPERNFVYEIGFKTELLDRRLRVNGDIFRSNYKDIQFLSLVGGLPLTQNAAAGEAWGGELEVTGQFDGLGFNLGVGYLDASFTRDTCLNDSNSQGTDPQCTPGNRLVAKGTVLPFSPKWTINAGIQYELPLGGDLTLTPRLQWSHLAEQYATPFLTVATRVPGRDVFDARLTLKIDDKYTLEGFATNLTNRLYIASQVQDSSSATGGIIYGAPPQYGLRLIVRFGT